MAALPSCLTEGLWAARSAARTITPCRSAQRATLASAATATPARSRSSLVLMHIAYLTDGLATRLLPTWAQRLQNDQRRRSLRSQRAAAGLSLQF